MNNFRVRQLGWIGGIFALFVAVIGVANVSAEVIEVESEIYASLSGFVYCDIDNSGTYNNSEDRIRDVLIILDGLIDPIDPESPEAEAWGVGQRPLDPGEKETLQRIAWTDSQGRYRFDDVLPGIYSITEVTPYMFVEGKKNAAGTLGGKVVTSNQFAKIDVNALAVGTGYNFGEWGLRTKYLSKRSLIVVVPEPSTAALLFVMSVLGVYWLLKR